MNKARGPVTLEDLIRHIESRYHDLIAIHADLMDGFKAAVASGDIDSADLLAVRLEHQVETLQETKDNLSHLFKLAMERTMKRIRKQDREE